MVNRSCPVVVVWLPLLLAAVVAAGGCAPKRVLQTGPQLKETPAASPAARNIPGKAAGKRSPLEHGAVRDASESGGTQPDGLPYPADLEAAAESDTTFGEPGHLVADLALGQVGKPYGWGSIGPDRFDCSGLALYVYRQLGIALPRVAIEQASAGVHVERPELKPGDLVFFSLKSPFDHVGIFLGNNKFAHAPRRRESVRVDNLSDAWWNRAYRGARRVFGAEP